FGALPGLVLLPPLPAPDHAEAEDDAGDQAAAGVAQPTADALALVMLIVQIVDRHAASKALSLGESGDADRAGARKVAPPCRPAEALPRSVADRRPSGLR